MNIKNLGPNRNGRFKQNYFEPKNLRKYVGDPNKIISRSGWEQRLMLLLDAHPSIIRWGSEPVAIPYYSRIKERMQNYYVDFYVEVDKGNGVIVKYLVEVKPEKQTKPPSQKLLEGNRTLAKIKRYNHELTTYITNSDKFAAAIKFAEERGMKFMICTEKFLF